MKRAFFARALFGLLLLTFSFSTTTASSKATEPDFGAAFTKVKNWFTGDKKEEVSSEDIAKMKDALEEIESSQNNKEEQEETSGKELPSLTTDANGNIVEDENQESSSSQSNKVFEGNSKQEEEGDIEEESESSNLEDSTSTEDTNSAPGKSESQSSEELSSVNVAREASLEVPEKSDSTGGSDSTASGKADSTATESDSDKADKKLLIRLVNTECDKLRKELRGVFNCVQLYNPEGEPSCAIKYQWCVLGKGKDKVKGEAVKCGIEHGIMALNKLIRDADKKFSKEVLKAGIARIEGLQWTDNKAEGKVKSVISLLKEEIDGL